MSLLDRRTFIQSAFSAAIAALFGRKNSQADEPVDVIWCGALTPHSVQVNARLNFDSTQVRLLASTSTNLSQPVLSDFKTANLQTNNRMVALPVSGLQPGTRYFYAVEADGQVDMASKGQFRTPPEGAFSFTLAFGSCAGTGSNHPIFDTIRNHDPLFLLHMGDLHYDNIRTNDRGLFRRAYERVLRQPRQAALYRAAPIAYMWDDHDYGPNDSDKTAPGREAARLTYQEYVPHYPLAAGSGNVAIYQAFTIGRVRFILTDTRSERTPNNAPDNSAKSMLGQTQKNWFKQQMLNANGVYPVIVWVCTSPWMADLPGSGYDNWAGYATERRELADFFAANDIQGLIMLSGDVHMLAIEDGRNNRYATSGARGFPIMQSSPFDRKNSSDLPDNTFSEGQFPGHQQFALMTVTDDGGPLIHIEWSGRTADDKELVWHEMAIPPGPRLDVSPQTLTFLAVKDGQQLLDRTLLIANLGVTAMNYSVTLDTPASWLHLSVSSGTLAPGQTRQIDVHVIPPALSYGVYKTQLRIAAGNATYSPQSVAVTFLYTAEPPTFLPLIAGDQ